MMVLPFIAVIATLIMCAIVSYTDIKENRISNRILLIFSLLGVILNILQYIFRIHVLWGMYFLNLGVITIFAILLYLLHIWAAGDSKLLVAIGIMLPANLCYFAGKIMLWGGLVVAISFIFSFIYIFVESIILFLTKRGHFEFVNIRDSIKEFLLSYVRNIVYISLVLKLENWIAEDWFSEQPIMMFVINICVIFLISSFKVLKNWYLVIGVFVASIVFSLLTQEWFLNIERVKYYLLAIGLMVIRAFINENNYATIPTEKLEKGMILSTAVTMLMSQMNYKGLPGISREDMSSRLTEEEVEAVISWGKTKKGLKEMVIVKKVPYAIFILLGVLGYFIVWEIFNIK